MRESSGGRASSLVVLLDLDPPLAAESDLHKDVKIIMKYSYYK